MATETYSFEITAEIKAARAAVEKFSDETQNRLDKINFNSAVSAISGGINIIQSAFGAVTKVFAPMIAQAAEAEESVRLLNNAMRITGEFSEYASQRAQNFAEALSKVTVYSDNQIVSAIALAKNFGLVNSEARKVVSTAADLSAITGKDLNTSVQELAATYNLFVSRDLKRMVKGLDSLTDAQLRAGGAVDLLAKRLAGSAQDATTSFVGQTAQLRNEVEKAQEAIGTFLIRGLGFWIRQFRAAKDATVDFIKSYQQAAAQDVNGIFKTTGDTIRRRIKEANDAFEEGRKERAAQSEAEKKRQIDAARTAAKAELEEFRKSFTEKKKELLLQSRTDQERIDQEFYKSSAFLARGYYDGQFKDAKEYLEALKILRAKYEKDSLDLSIKTERERAEAERKFDEARRKLFEDSVRDPIKQVIRYGASLDTQQAISVGAGFLQAVSKGAKGAQDLISKGIGDALSFALTGTDALAGPISEIVSLLGQGPEKTKEMVTQFAKAIPEMIKNLAESLPVLIETLVRELPPALAKAMPTVAVGFSTALIKNMPQIVKGFAEGLIQAAKGFVEELLNQIKTLGGLVGNNGIFGGGNGNGGFLSGSGIPILSDIGDFLGLANGGTIPDSPGLRGDKFPMFADAGETFIDRNLTQRLSAALDGGRFGGSGPTTIILQVGQQELARVLLDLNRGGFRTA